jgi:hypothetical protein
MKLLSAIIAIVLMLGCNKDKEECHYDCHNGDYYPTSQYSAADIEKVEDQCGCSCDLICQ